MSVLTDLVQDIEDYPRNHLTLEIYDVTPEGENINAGEDVVFGLRVTNTGPLDVHDLQLLVTGQTGVQVKGPSALATFGPTAFSNIFDVVRAHNGDQPVYMAGRMAFKAPSRAKAEADLVVVTVHAWNTDFDHPTSSHSREDLEAKVTYRAEVLPPT